jgi:hypothetical protein
LRDLLNQLRVEKELKSSELGDLGINSQIPKFLNLFN